MKIRIQKTRIQSAISVLLVLCYVAVPVRADMESDMDAIKVYNFVAGNKAAAVLLAGNNSSELYHDTLRLVAQDVGGKGVQFTFESTANTGKLLTGGSPELFLFNTGNIFDAGNFEGAIKAISPGGTLNQLDQTATQNMSGVTQNSSADFRVLANTGDLTSGGITFFVRYNEGESWNSFLAQEDFAFGAHVGALADGKSGAYVSVEAPSASPAVIPEPMTILIVGAGLAGLGLARRRLKK